jgi:hypothetical protein
MTSNEGNYLFWLNPYEQRKYRAGLYTIKDLEQWIEGKGEIIKSAKESW